MILEPGFTYHLHNETRSKSLLTLMNRLQMTVSYEKHSNLYIDNIGVLTFCPPSMSAGTLHSLLFITLIGRNVQWMATSSNMAQNNARPTGKPLVQSSRLFLNDN